MKNEHFDLEKDIKDILKKLHIPFHLQGYYYLIDAVVLMVKNNWDNKDLSNKIYPMIGENNDTSARAVERSIRYAIKWSENTMEKVGRRRMFEEGVEDINGLKFEFYGRRTNEKIIMSILQALNVKN